MFNPRVRHDIIVTASSQALPLYSRFPKCLCAHIPSRHKPELSLAVFLSLAKKPCHAGVRVCECECERVVHTWVHVTERRAGCPGRLWPGPLAGSSPAGPAIAWWWCRPSGPGRTCCPSAGRAGTAAGLLWLYGRGRASHITPLVYRGQLNCEICRR